MLQSGRNILKRISKYVRHWNIEHVNEWCTPEHMQYNDYAEYIKVSAMYYISNAEH